MGYDRGKQIYKAVLGGVSRTALESSYLQRRVAINKEVAITARDANARHERQCRIC